MVLGSGGDGDVQAAFAATLVDEWVRCGVAHAVVCPGSRSTPLAVALAMQPEIEVHVRLDERSAGFTALGIGKADGYPALVVTTSGTAAAELHPAVVEADLAGVPLIVCTADRPPELRGVGAPQTIDQTHLFGRAPRWFVDAGVPDTDARSSWRSLASRAVAESMSGAAGPGPVHLNLPFREPLLGDPAAGGGVSPGRANGRPWHVVVAGAVSPPVGRVPSLVEEGLFSPARRGVIVAGAGAGDATAVLTLSALLGWPVLADPRSGLRTLDPGVIGTADGILRSPRFAREHVPEVVLHLGERWVSKVVNGFLSTAVEDGAPSIVVDPRGRWVDPERESAVFVRADPTLLCHEVVGCVGRGSGAAGSDPGGPAATGSPHVDSGSRNGWFESWCDAEHRASAVIGSMLDGNAAPTPAGRSLDEPSLAHRLVGRLPAEATLVVSSSMPIRDVEAFGLPRQRPPRVLANRGANGIDGVVSTALGVALAADGPTVALVGDLAFFHDLSGLVRSDQFEADLTVVVADNVGGGIFSFLPPASVLDAHLFDRLFGTPQSPDPAAVAAVLGWTVDDLGPGAVAGDFDAALDHRLGKGGLSVIRVRLPGRAENVVIHDRINEAIVDAVDEGLI
jgi:2-succinyl-5-enolpyruvyl-6-hydroxy-3-cyclohexene-1-carboxylate synthase